MRHLDDDEIRRLLDDHGRDPESFTPDEIVNRAVGHDPYVPTTHSPAATSTEVDDSAEDRRAANRSAFRNTRKD